MKQVYGELTPATGAHLGGICNIQIAPIEWLSSAWQKAFSTGKVISIQLTAGRELINIELLQPTYKFSEIPKSGKAGSYFDITVTGTSNYTDDATLQILNTYRYHEWFAVVKDVNGLYRVIGNKDGGLIFEFSIAEDNGNHEKKIELAMAMQSEFPAAFYGDAVVVVEPKLHLVQGFALSNPSADNIKIEWGTNADYPVGFNYVLQRSLNSNFSSATTLTLSGGDLAAFFYTDAGKEYNTTYYYRMKAQAAGYTDSDWISASLLIEADGILYDHLWLDLDAELDVTTTTVGPDDFVTQWTDQVAGRVFNSINGNPLYKPAEINGLAAISNENDSYVGFVSAAGVDLPDSSTGMTIYIVGAQAALNDYNGAFIRHGNNILLARKESTTQLTAKMRYTYPLVFTTGIADDGWCVMRLHYEGGSHDIAVNNGTPVSATISLENPWAPSPIYLMRNTVTTGNKKIARILIYTKEHTPTERIQVENYLGGLYGITI